ncbi:hypothetical protein, partial [Burkholderia multivorans]|uniref:hypothetical protein n=1 Tax=Burkholderia multivorans TaxID=87883 RepID=UPI001C655EAD
MDQYTNAMGEWNVSTPSTTKLNILLGYYADPQERTEAQAGTGQEVPGSEVVVDSGSGSLAPLLLGGSILALVIAGVWLLRRLRQGAAYRLPSRLLDRVDTLQRDSLRDSI